MRTDLETYLSENCLVKTDRASMLASLEVRVPYLDETVLERILPLPVHAKIPGGQLKALLMPLARRLLPREVWDRPKQGFGGPLNAWLAGAWRPAVERALDWGESNSLSLITATCAICMLSTSPRARSGKHFGTRSSFLRGPWHIPSRYEDRLYKRYHLWMGIRCLGHWRCRATAMAACSCSCCDWLVGDSRCVRST